MATSPMPAGAGPAALEKDEAKTGANGLGFRGRRTADSVDSTQAVHAAQLAEALRRKSDATLIARAALAGVELVKLADGTWIASRWGLVRPLATDAEAEAWLARVGAPA